MKIKVRRLFKYMLDSITTHELKPGEYQVPQEVDSDVAILAIQFGAAVRVNEPVKTPAPENKVKTPAPENKVKTVRKVKK
jgi:hypothetical protein